MPPDVCQANSFKPDEVLKGDGGRRVARLGYRSYWRGRPLADRLSNPGMDDQSSRGWGGRGCCTATTRAARMAARHSDALHTGYALLIMCNGEASRSLR